MDKTGKKSKIAILGGGVGSMVTAVQLTNDPDWKDHFSSITVYQMGWRLGGKGASGRGKYDRIEEHGLHVWMGFYENAFKAIKTVYEELDRPKDTPLATWEDAFKKHDSIVLMEQFKNTWRKWPLEFKPNDLIPGNGDDIPSLWQHMLHVIGLLEMVISSSDTRRPKSWLEKLWQKFTDTEKGVKYVVEAGLMEPGSRLITKIRNHAHSLSKNSMDHDKKDHEFLSGRISELSAWADQHFKDKLDDDLKRHLYVVIDFSLSVMRGILGHGLLKKQLDFDALDEYDMVEWLKLNGASDITCDSGLIHGMYDLMLAYEDGDVNTPSFGAGTFLHFAIRMTLTYKGAIFWKMQAGMGDTIFAPIYEVLKKRGVNFEFFNCVDQLNLSADKKSIESIDINIQATVKDGEYDPLVNIKGLPCWPAEPVYDQLVEGKELKENNINLESFWTTWQSVAKKTLKSGVDFDKVILGIPVGSHPYICKQLIATNSDWAEMVSNVKTTRTLALQLWIEKDLKGLGWETDSPIIDSYVEPFNTWADMSQLIDKESWPDNAPLNNVAYFCGPMKGGIPDQSLSDTPEKATHAVKTMAVEWLKKYPGFLWPQAVDENGELDWSILTDPDNRFGEARLDAQFWRANVDPSERYVLSVAKSTKHRMRADKTGFDNLIITGDWTWNPINAGCVEGTTMSGMMAANVLLGKPIDFKIVGFHRS